MRVLTYKDGFYASQKNICFAMLRIYCSAELSCSNNTVFLLWCYIILIQHWCVSCRCGKTNYSGSGLHKCSHCRWVFDVAKPQTWK